MDPTTKPLAAIRAGILSLSTFVGLGLKRAQFRLLSALAETDPEVTDFAARLNSTTPYIVPENKSVMVAIRAGSVTFTKPAAEGVEPVTRTLTAAAGSIAVTGRFTKATFVSLVGSSDCDILIEEY